MSNTIKFGERTLAILKNYATIHPSIKFVAGQDLIVGDSTGTVLACAKIDETIPTVFPIANLSGLNTILGMKSFDGASLDFSEEGMINIKGKGQAVKFHASDEMFADLPGEPIELENEDFKADVNPEVIKEFRKACGALGHTICKFVNLDGKAYMVGNNPLLPNSNDFKVELGDTDKEDGEFSIKIANLSLILDGNYTVTAQSDMLVKFISADERLQYMIGIELSDD